MKRHVSGLSLLIFWMLTINASGFTGLQRFSDEFYAAQKYFYAETKRVFPKIIKDKAYPEVPIKGAILKEDLDKITPLRDYLKARRAFIEEVQKYPEQLYPEIFQFLYKHPALQVSVSNKAKFEAIEIYFNAFYFLFSPDPYEYFHPEVKCNPCPVVFCNTGDKKNQVTVSVSNSSKTELYMMLNQGRLGEGLSFTGKNPVSLKKGASLSLPFVVNLSKLETDSCFRVYEVVLADPAQPKIKLTARVIVLPSKNFLQLPVQFFRLHYQYTTHLKNIDLFTDRTSGPERCSGKNCSGEWYLPLRKSTPLYEQYAFGDVAKVQVNLKSFSPPLYSLKQAVLELEFTERGELTGKARDCPGPVPNSLGPCPPEAANNGKQLYGNRKIDCSFFIPEGKTAEVSLRFDYEDLHQTSPPNVTLSWLDQKKLLLLVSGPGGKIIYKELFNSTSLHTSLNRLQAGEYTCSVFPVSPDKNKQQPEFEINHLNSPARAHFDFKLKAWLCLKEY